MTMAIPSATTGRVSALFWRKPSLALFLLLLGPVPPNESCVSVFLGSQFQ